MRPCLTGLGHPPARRRRGGGMDKNIREVIRATDWLTEQIEKIREQAKNRGLILKVGKIELGVYGAELTVSIDQKGKNV